MKSLITRIAAGAIVTGALLLNAQEPAPRRHMRMYDPATETSIKGTVQEVKQGERPMMMGTHLIVKAGESATEVMLGPTDFIQSKGFSFAKGDAVEVTGSKMSSDGTSYIVAREVTKEGKTLTLRDKDGRPQWAGMGMRQRVPPKKQ